MSYETCRFGVGRLGMTRQRSITKCFKLFVKLSGFDNHMRTVVACEVSVNFFCLASQNRVPILQKYAWAIVERCQQQSNTKKTRRGSSSSVQMLNTSLQQGCCAKSEARSASWVYYIVARSTQTGHLPSGCNWFLSIKQRITSSKWKVLGHVMVFFWDGLSKAWLQWYSHFSAGSILCTWASYAKWPSPDLQTANHRGPGQKWASETHSGWGCSCRVLRL